MTALDRLKEAIAKIEELSSPCLLCPRECKAKRKEGEVGVCGLTDKLKVFCCNLHFGEEPPLSGTGLTEGVKAKGSGTIFFSGSLVTLIILYAGGTAFLAFIFTFSFFAMHFEHDDWHLPLLWTALFLWGISLAGGYGLFRLSRNAEVQKK